MAKRKRKKKKRVIQDPSTERPRPSKAEEDKIQGAKPGKKKLYLLAVPVILLLAGSLLLFLILKPEQKVKIDQSLNVLLITLDTTRSDRLGCYGYSGAKTPSLDSLAAGGVLFQNAYCQVPLTCPSHCSILTGTTPLYHQVRNNGTYSLSPEIQTLAESLKEKGLKTAAFVSSFTVDSRFGLDQGFDVYDDQVTPGQAFKALNSERRADEVFGSFARWLEENRSDQFFCWVHFFDPHLPYDPPPPFREEFLNEPYDGEIAYMDFYIGKIVEKLKEYGILRKTLVILAGDHGEALGDKEENGHGVFIYESTMRVPLIFYGEGFIPRGEAISARVRLIDLMPSILEMLDVPVPKDVQGTSLLPWIEGKKKEDLSSYIETYFPRENYGWSELVGLLEGEWKYIRAPREELYNLVQDHNEEHNLFTEEQKTAAEIRNRLDGLIKNQTSSLTAGRRALTAEEEERLRSLGYVALSEGPSQGDLPDPKDMRDELRLIQQAGDAELEENFEEAAAIYEKVLALRPSVTTSYINLALIQAKMMKFDEAIRTLELGLERIPDSEVLLSRLGHTYMVVGRLKKALDTFDLVLKDNPRHFDSLLASAWMLGLMGQKEDALAYYKKALEVEPENKFARKNFALNLATSGMITQAIDIYKDLVNEFPDDYEVYQDLGIAYSYAGDVGLSIENLEKAVSIHPTPSAYFNLAVAMKKVGKIEEAVRYIQLYLENPEGESEESISRARAELQNLEEILKR